MKRVDAYSVLAVGYDVVMEHVDYDHWASHVLALITDFAPETRRILELGCGTGSFALSLTGLESFEYIASDISEKMVGVARAKAALYGEEIQFEVADFTDFAVEEPVDAVLLLYDGLNYVLDPARLSDLFGCVFRAIRPGGIFVFDQSTPANSVNNEALFEDSGEAEGFSYVRHSRYDPVTRLHTTTFEMEALGKQFTEEHHQRAYSVEEVREAATRAGFVPEAAFEDFGRTPATGSSERVHWVVRRPD